MRVFKAKGFDKFARRQNISDDKLCEAVADAEQGQIDADYGGGVIKQRVSRPGEGKSGGFRVIVCFRQAERAFFVHGFAKSDKANLDSDEVKTYKQLAKILFALSDEDLEKALKNKDFTEVQCDG
ncbi:type II toxin-antitoxin system RelE/ParE family toxin [bacterium]|nr:type II toxin-antitoxin system RelE/ParE family toxin [bacterium]